MPNNNNRDIARYRGSEASKSDGQRRHWHGRTTEPGRIHGEDSLEASREEDPKDDDDYIYMGFDTPAATRIGDERNDDPEIERLRKHHDGRHQSDGGNSARETERDKERISQAICSALPIARQEKEHVLAAMKTFNLDRFGSQRSIPKVALGAVAVIVDEHHRDGAEELDELICRSEKFREIKKKHEISMSDLSTVKEIIRDILNSNSVPVNSDSRNRDPALPQRTAPNELPREYWDELTSEAWANIARTWQRQPEKFKNAVPPEYKERVGLLQNWQPWTDRDEAEKQDNVSRTDTLVEFYDDDLAEEAEKLVEQSEPAGDSDSE